MLEVLANLAGRACVIYVDDVKVAGRVVEELIVKLRAVLLRFTERALFLAAHTLVLFANEVKWYDKLYSGMAVRHDPRRVRGLVEMRRPETVGAPMKFLQATNWMRFAQPHIHSKNWVTATSFDGTSTGGNEPHEKRGVAAGFDGWRLDAVAGGSLGQLPRDVDQRF